MRPQDHPEYFRFPAPEGRSRESTIVLDAEGRFFHHGAPVAHPGMARAFASWIDVHPDNGRFILNNGYDWSYFRVEDVPFYVLGVREQGGQLWLALSDGSECPLELGQSQEAPGAGVSPLTVGERDALYTTVKNGKFRARFTQAAQTALAPWLASDENGQILLEIAGRRQPLGNFGEGP